MSANPRIVTDLIVRRRAGVVELLLGQYSLQHERPYLRGLVSGPGGKLQPGEDPVAGGLREAAEEAGRRAGELRPIVVGRYWADVIGHGFDPGGVDVYAVLLEAPEEWAPEEPEPDKIGAWRWCPLDRLPDPLRLSPLCNLSVALLGLRMMA